MTYKQDIPWAPHDALDRMLEINRIDSWLRGLCDVAPRERSSKTDSVLSTAFNSYSLALMTGGLHLHDIEKTVGFRRLLSVCNGAGQHLDVKLTDDARLQVLFRSEKPLSTGRILDARTSNVHRAQFQRK